MRLRPRLAALLAPVAVGACIAVGACVGGGAGSMPRRFGPPGAELGPPGEPPVRVVRAPEVREVSLAAALAARRRGDLPAPHRGETPAPALRVPADLRGLVGRRDPREPFTAALGWARELGWAPLAGASGAELVAHADEAGRLGAPDGAIAPGELLVFDRAVGDGRADLVGVAIARDARGVVEFVWLGGGVVRRGFVDPARPRTRRDAARAVVNTFLRAGKRWPPKGTRYLAGELLAHVVR